MDVNLREERIDSEVTLREAVRFMEEKDLHAVPVVKGNKVLGVISYEGVLRGFIDASAKVKYYVERVKKTLFLPSESGIFAIFAKRGNRVVVVTDLYGRFKGFVPREDVVKGLKLKSLTRDVLESEFVELDGREIVAKARLLMAKLGKSEIPVSEDRKFLGLVTAKRIVEKAIELGNPPIGLTEISYTRLKDFDLVNYYLINGTEGSEAIKYFSLGLSEVPLISEGKIEAVASVSKLFESMIRIRAENGITVGLFSYNVSDEIIEEIKSFLNEVLPSFKLLRSKRINLSIENIPENKFYLNATIKAKSVKIGIKEAGSDPKALILEAFKRLESSLRSANENKKDE